MDLKEVTGKELLDMLFKRFSDQFRKRRYATNSYPSNIAMYVHGRMLNLNEALNIRLKDGDEVHLLEVVSGG